MTDRKSLQINIGQASVLLRYGICQRCIKGKSCGKDPPSPQPEMKVQCLNHRLLIPRFLNIRNSRLK